MCSTAEMIHARQRRDQRRQLRSEGRCRDLLGAVGRARTVTARALHRVAAPLHDVAATADEHLDLLVSLRVWVGNPRQRPSTGLARLGVQVRGLVDLLRWQQLAVRAFVPLLTATLALRLRLLRLSRAPECRPRAVTRRGQVRVRRVLLPLLLQLLHRREQCRLLSLELLNLGLRLSEFGLRLTEFGLRLTELRDDSRVFLGADRHPPV